MGLPATEESIEDLHKIATGTWFHGTLSRIDEFWPCTHFGSRRAAVLATAIKYFEQQWPGTPKLIEVDLSFASPSALRLLPEWGKRGAIGAAYALCRFGTEEQDAFQAVKNDLIAKFRENETEGRLLVEQTLLPLVEKLGIQALMYRNLVEEDTDALSICLLNPAPVNFAPRKVSLIDIHEMADVFESALASKLNRISPQRMAEIRERIVRETSS